MSQATPMLTNKTFAGVGLQRSACWFASVCAATGTDGGYRGRDSSQKLFILSSTDTSLYKHV